MTRAECEKALETIGGWSLWDSERTESGMWKVKDASYNEYKVIEKLINEHFDNPPLKFEELEDGEWYWCEAYGWCLMNFYEDLDGKIHYKAKTVLHNEIDLLVEFEENRFYRKQKED